MKELIESIARIIEPIWFNGVVKMSHRFGQEQIDVHPLDNFPGQHLKYQETARTKAKEILTLLQNYMIPEGYICHPA